MYGLHYNHSKKFTESKFKKWAEKARELRDRYEDEQIEEFKVEIRKLSENYWK